MATFDPATAVIALSGAGTGIVTGAPTFQWDWFDGSVWTTVASIVSGSAVNAGVNVGGASIHSGTVQGLRPNFIGTWTGRIKICIQF